MVTNAIPMNMKILKVFIAVAVILGGCKGNKSGSGSDENAAMEVNKINAVSIYDKVPVRVSPQKESKYLTSLNLGEKMLYLGETITDSASSNEYHKVELSDGAIAWARTYGVILDAEPAAIVSKTPVYKRPDLVNKTDKILNPLEFVVIVNSKGEWVEVKGAKKKKSGWIKKQYLTIKKEEVAVATMAFKSILDADGQIIKENVPGFVDELPYQNTGFTGYLQEILDEQVGAAVEEAIEEYESEYYNEEE
jgi:hypothetical protein